MNQKLVITIDTEEDNWGNYFAIDNTVKNIEMIPRLQAIFDRYGAKPTYLVDWPVVTDVRARDILMDIRGRGRCEIGSHCHPWNTPPVEEAPNPFNSMMCNLPEQLVKSKMANLSAVTYERMGFKPTSFRAGRWGFGSQVAQSLEENGYQTDSSICPGIDWREDHGPDYSDAANKPYRFFPPDIMSANGAGSLIEVPASMGFLQPHGRILQRLRKRLLSPVFRRFHLIGLLERSHLMNFRWLSPELSSADDMIALSRALLKQGCPVLNLSFHSTTLLPGMSPYVRSQNDLEDFLFRIETVLKFATTEGIVFTTLSAVVP